MFCLKYDFAMEPPKNPETVYEPDQDAPCDSLPPLRYKPKQIRLCWFDNISFEIISDDPEPDYSDFNDTP